MKKLLFYLSITNIEIWHMIQYNIAQVWGNGHPSRPHGRFFDKCWTRSRRTWLFCRGNERIKSRKRHSPSWHSFRVDYEYIELFPKIAHDERQLWFRIENEEELFYMLNNKKNVEIEHNQRIFENMTIKINYFNIAFFGAGAANSATIIQIQQEDL